MIPVYIVEVSDHYSLVQQEENGVVDRYYIPRGIFPNSLRNVPAELPEWMLKYKIPYTDVHLEDVLGESHVNIQDLEQACRRVGLWKKEDYRSAPGKVKRVLIQLGRDDLDVATVLNAALVEVEAR